MKLKVKRQVQIVKPDATDEDVDNMLSSSSSLNDNGRGQGLQIYKQAILSHGGQVDHSVAHAYETCRDKYQDVVKLEESVAELHQMFVDLSLLVEEQGELINSIDYQINTAADYVDQGTREVAKAVRHQSCAR